MAAHAHSRTHVPHTPHASSNRASKKHSNTYGNLHNVEYPNGVSRGQLLLA